jgi:xanthine dehydrogenase accessory factor
MEHKFVEMARARLLAGNHLCTLHRQVHNKTETDNQSGMICSGEQTNIIYAVKPADLEIIETLLNIISNNRECLLGISPAGIKIMEKIEETGEGLNLENSETWLYIERITHRNRLLIIGGGHCSLALSRQMKLLNFTVLLYEDRSQLPTLIANEYVDEKIVVESYSDLEHVISSDANTYLVVMTVGYRTDDLALRALKDKSFKYIGVLGSRKKIETMINQYRTDNFSEKWISSIHAPAGVTINSHTPEEIAVSIAAEIIRTKNSFG